MHKSNKPFPAQVGFSLVFVTTTEGKLELQVKVLAEEAQGFSSYPGLHTTPTSRPLTSTSTP